MFGFFSGSSQPIKTQLTQVPLATFNYECPSHLSLINTKIMRFKKTLEDLQIIDSNIIWGASIGGVCYLGAYVFPLVLASIAGSCFASYHLGLRRQAVIDYRQAQMELIETYNWAMGKETGDHWNKLAVETLQELIMTLGPWVSTSTIHTWGTNDLKPRLSSMTRRRSDIPEAFEEQLKEFASGIQTTSCAFRLYGEDGINDLFAVLRESVVSKIADTVFTPQPKAR